MKPFNNQTLKLIPLGGVGDVTKNMYVYEYGNDIIIVDCGVGFPDEAMPGVDLVIPDISYLREKKDKRLLYEDALELISQYDLALENAFRTAHKTTSIN